MAWHAVLPFTLCRCPRALVLADASKDVLYPYFFYLVPDIGAGVWVLHVTTPFSSTDTGLPVATGPAMFDLFFATGWKLLCARCVRAACGPTGDSPTASSPRKRGAKTFSRPSSASSIMSLNKGATQRSGGGRMWCIHREDVVVLFLSVLPHDALLVSCTRCCSGPPHHPRHAMLSGCVCRSSVCWSVSARRLLRLV